jgi:dimethylhistidine N-methyltransferase
MTVVQTALYSPAVKLSATEVFRADVLRGLASAPKRIPSKYFYDKRGSELFDRICELEEYYVTRCELAIMRSHAREMAASLGDSLRLVELGSGSSIKTRLLLDHLDSPAAYIPIDVSGQHLEESCADLRCEFPEIEVLPLCADFTNRVTLPTPPTPQRATAVYFPGSTLGNFEWHNAGLLLENIHGMCGVGGSLLLGIDLRKDPRVVHAAYNDREGVTAAFNLNLLYRVNRELDADFDPDAFAHRAVYNERLGRIESSLVSQRRQMASVAGQEFGFEKGESIYTEYSYKYSIPEFARFASGRGFKLQRQWTDHDNYFAVLHLLAVD